ncbi:MAG: hypothetical protein EXS52_00480 [Candidatus Staskawiczbacteria bacterium]|nr:hypothetical protein [Candidatus Staskawiczbacteria bacterium]
MTLILPKDTKALAWDACEKFLLRCKEPSKAFTATLQSKSGFLVSHWEAGSGVMPTHYLRRIGYSSPTYVTLDSFLRFGAGTEDPLRPRTLSAAQNLVKVCNKKFGLNFGLIFWIQIGAEFVPDDYYRAMTEGKLEAPAKK